MRWKKIWESRDGKSGTYLSAQDLVFKSVPMVSDFSFSSSMSSGVVQSVPAGTQPSVLERALQLRLLPGLLPWQRGAGLGDPSGRRVPQDRRVSGPGGRAALLLHGHAVGRAPPAPGDRQLHPAAAPGGVARSPVVRHLLHRGMNQLDRCSVWSVSPGPAAEKTTAGPQRIHELSVMNTLLLVKCWPNHSCGNLYCSVHHWVKRQNTKLMHKAGIRV